MSVALASTAPVRSSVRTAPWHSIAVGAVAVGLAFLPMLVPPLPGNAAPVDLLLLSAIVGVLLWAGANELRLHIPYALPVGILVVAGALSALLGPFPTAGALALFQDITVLAWCAAVANVARSPHDLSVLLRAWSWSAIAWASILVVSEATHHKAIAGLMEGGKRAAFTLGNPNRAGSYFVVSLMVMLAAPRPRSWMGRIAGSAVLLAAIVFTGSNAALGGVVAAALIALFVSVQRRAGLITALAAVAIGIVLLATAVTLVSRQNLLGRAQQSSNTLIRNSLGRTERSGEDRIVQFGQLLSLYSSGGVLGHGPAATKDVLAQKGAGYVKEAHDDYAAVLVERGVIGAIGLLLLIGAIAYRGVGIGGGNLAPAFAQTVRTAPLLGALGAVAVGSVFHEVLHYRHVWALFGVIAALYLWGRNGSASEEAR